LLPLHLQRLPFAIIPAIYALPPTPLVYAIHHTILVMAISCKGQDEAAPSEVIPPLRYCQLSRLGGWVNPHREQQTIPQGPTSSPPKSFFTPTAKAHPDQAVLATSAEARGATHRARPRSPFCIVSNYERIRSPRLPLRIWPLQYIVMWLGFCARINTILCTHTLCLDPPPRHRPHYCAIQCFPPTPRYCNIYHTLLVMAILCKR